MDLNLDISRSVRQMLLAFLLIILPWIVIGLSLFIGFESVWIYVLLILWFGMGFIFFAALD